MQAKRNPILGGEDDRNDWGILVLLVGQDDQRPWSVEELVAEHGDRVQALDAIARLHKSGLIHRTSDELVFPTRAAIHYARINL
jgi:hypothetical protein